MAISRDKEAIKQLLERGVETVYPNNEFLEKALLKGEQLTLYTGYDPTAPTLHVGHGITLLKLRDFQKLGHKIIFLIGDITATIGDPTDKSAARKKLTREEVLDNCKLYQSQASAILDFEGENPAEIKYNSEWLGKMNFFDVLELTSHFTVQQMSQRDMFKRRLHWRSVCAKCSHENLREPNYHQSQLGVLESYKIGELATIEWKCEKCEFVYKMIDGGEFSAPQPIYLHEFLYPIMQGYDSVAMDVDGEVGGNDQTFNMLAGRTLMKVGIFNHKPKDKFVVAGKLLTDNSGKKMGKSEGNMIAFNDTPEDMFGKIMSWTDEMIVPAFEICTRVPMNEVEALEKELKQGANPRDAKLKLAYAITQTFLGEEAAQKGKTHFETVIQGSGKPQDMPEIKPSAYDIVTVLVESNLCSSKGDARRNIEGGGVKLNDEKVDNLEAEVKKGDIVQKGKRFFVKIV